jgi:hypothetical protein
MEGFKVEEVKRGIYIYKRKRRERDVAKSSGSPRRKEAATIKRVPPCPYSIMRVAEPPLPQPPCPRLTPK